MRSTFGRPSSGPTCSPATLLERLPSTLSTTACSTTLLNMARCATTRAGPSASPTTLFRPKTTPDPPVLTSDFRPVDRGRLAVVPRLERGLVDAVRTRIRGTINTDVKVTAMGSAPLVILGDHPGTLDRIGSGAGPNSGGQNLMSQVGSNQNELNAHAGMTNECLEHGPRALSVETELFADTLTTSPATEIDESIQPVSRSVVVAQVKPEVNIQTVLMRPMRRVPTTTGTRKIADSQMGTGKTDGHLVGDIFDQRDQLARSPPRVLTTQLHRQFGRVLELDPAKQMTSIGATERSAFLSQQ